GYGSAQELSSKSWRTLFPLTELQHFQNTVLPQLHKRGRTRTELSGIKRWGTRFPIELSLTVLEGGEAICIVKEVTKRKEAEYQTALMSLFAELNPFPVLRIKPSGQILMANQSSVDIFSKPSFAKVSLYELIPGVTEAEVRACIKNDSLFSCTSEINGRHFHFIFRGVADRCFAQVYGTDISELVDAKKELQESQLFLRKVIDTDPNLIFVKDRQGKFVMANQTVAELYGTSTEDLVGKTDRDFNPNIEETNRFFEDDRDVIDNLSEKIIREEITDKQGNVHWLETVKKPFITRNNETLVLGVGHDVTDNRALQAQLMQSQKMEAIGKLAGGIAHDFNNLLTGIIGFTTLLQNCPTNPEQVLQSATMIQSAAEKAGSLTEKLLGFARQGKHQNKLLDLHITITDTLQLLRRTVEENIAIHEVLCPTALTVMGDPVQLQQVILNLIVNARDAIHAKDCVSSKDYISIATQIHFDNPPTALALAQGNWIEVKIDDSGCGISEKNLDRIFEPFFTTKAKTGTGLGLATVYSIVKAHRGAIVLESQENKGTTFDILLPLCSDVHLSEPEQPSPQKEEIPKGSETILVVDDEEAVRMVIQRSLELMGYTVLTAESGKAALAIFAEHAAEISLVVLDMIMPEMPGDELFYELQKIDSGLKVLIASGYSNDGRTRA
ncbi:MAG: PAS domain S-box protein, partial [Bdellovibrionales bacterium]|nr:PAS domain S-box protein [Bdellovibrionales bacterium]